MKKTTKPQQARAIKKLSKKLTEEQAGDVLFDTIRAIVAKHYPDALSASLVVRLPEGPSAVIPVHRSEAQRQRMALLETSWSG